MGWNKGYEIFEKSVISAYDAGDLDKQKLSELMEPYRDTDIDSGGSRNLLSKDGKDVQEIVVKTWGLDIPPEPPKGLDDDGAWEDYYEKLYDLFYIVTDHFGWA